MAEDFTEASAMEADASAPDELSAATASDAAPRWKPINKTRLYVAALMGVVTLASATGSTWYWASRPEPESIVVPDSVRVADLAAEPQAAWEFDDTLGADKTFLLDEVHVVPVDDDAALVMPTFDYEYLAAERARTSSHYVPGATWYDGYDQDYEDGYSAAERYRADYNALPKDSYYRAQGLVWRDYLPDNDNEWEFYQAHPGFQDGVGDARSREARGANKLKDSIELDFVPAIALVDLATGDPKWTVDLSDRIEVPNGGAVFELYDVKGRGFVVVHVELYVPVAYQISPLARDGAVVLTLDKKTGGVIDALEFTENEFVTVDTGGGGVFVSKNHFETWTLQRFDSGHISGDPLWEVTTTSDSFGPDLRPAVSYSEDTRTVFAYDADSGELAEWAAGDPSTRDALVVGDQRVHIDKVPNGSFVELTAYDSVGAMTWEERLSVDYVGAGDGALFIADVDHDAFGDADPHGTTNLMRIDPMTGDDMWSAPFAKDVQLRGADGAGGLGNVGGTLVLASRSSSEIWSVDRESGEVTGTYTADAGPWLGATSFYAIEGDELLAFTPGQVGSLWAFTLAGEESVIQVGSHLVVRNSDDRTLSGLA